MKLPRRRFLYAYAAGSAVGLSALHPLAQAQTYSSRPLHLIEGFGAGGTPDILARLLGQWLAERLGQPFVVENRSGATGRIAAEAVVRAAPDGHTLLLAATGNAIDAIFRSGPNYDFSRDIAPANDDVHGPTPADLEIGYQIQLQRAIVYYNSWRRGYLGHSPKNAARAPKARSAFLCGRCSPHRVRFGYFDALRKVVQRLAGPRRWPALLDRK